MKAGDLDRRVTLLHRTTAPDAQNAPVETYTVLDVVWAQVVPVNGRDYLLAEQIHSQETLRFRMRYRSDITRQDRLQYLGATYTITHIAEIGRRSGLELLGELVTP